MNLGFKFKGISGGTSVSRTHRHTLTRDVQSTYGVEYGLSNTTNCTTNDKEGAGIYQWIVSTEDMMQQAFTWHTVCRTGDNWN